MEAVNTHIMQSNKITK